MRSARGISAFAAAVATALAGCSGETVELQPERTRSEAEKAGYLRAPELLEVAAGQADGIVVRGRATPQARVRAATLGGEAFGATADEEGRFALQLPDNQGPLLAALSVEEGGRSTLAEGWLFVPPRDLNAATVLRPGAPARMLDPGAPLIATVDFDAGGGLAVGGRSAPGAEVRLTVNGVAAPPVIADSAGLYGFRLTRMAAGAHSIRVESGELEGQRTVVLGLGTADRLNASRIDGGWRVEWATPGGGAQTTLIYSGDRAS